VKYPLFLSDSNDTLIFSADFRKILNVKFHAIRFSRIQAVPGGWTDGETDTTKLIVAFSQFYKSAWNRSINKLYVISESGRDEYLYYGFLGYLQCVVWVNRYHCIGAACCHSIQCSEDKTVCVNWPYGTDKRERFHNHVNGLHRNIQFTMDSARDGHRTFLEIDIYKRPHGSLGRKVYRKPTHSNFYLSPGSHYPPYNVQCSISMLVQTPGFLCDKVSLHDELEFLKTTFREYGYGIKQIRRALNPAVRTSKSKQKTTSVVLLSIYPDDKTAGSAVCWSNKTLNVLSCRLGRSPVSFVLRRMTWDWEIREFTAYPASVVSYTLDRLVVL